MADVLELSVETRERVGKGAARATRALGKVPGVIYGDKKDPEAISLDRREMERLLDTGKFLSTLYTIAVSGTTQRVIARDVQFDPVRDFPIHVDFLRLGRGATINVEIPMTFINEEESEGLRQGGVLNVVRYTVEVICPADAIPDEFVGDLANLGLGDSLHISDVTLPEGVEPTITDRDFTIATIAAPAGLLGDDEEEDDEDEEFEGVEGVEGEEGEGEAAEEGDDD
jgi:large subunit ribosomal protein L25